MSTLIVKNVEKKSEAHTSQFQQEDILTVTIHDLRFNYSGETIIRHPKSSQDQKVELKSENKVDISSEIESEKPNGFLIKIVKAYKEYREKRSIEEVKRAIQTGLVTGANINHFAPRY